MKRIAWTEQARADVRSLDKNIAMRILSALHRFAESGTGDVKALQAGAEELRLRVGAYRLFFVLSGDDVIEVRRVRHRREAYR
ncbi:MAG: type II toxin-antitoxin system RelE/ParE family toxin [Bryobacteraceae bacterium]|nr:type II toxin-antitoxin system RelE/ParE family toxin [Bryobacteraceae bacterium]